jgi:hypothetical protein
MGLFDFLLQKVTPTAIATRLGYRWSLYIVRNEKELLYAMHANSVFGMLGYVMLYFANGSRPVAPWGLYLNFNHTNKTIKLGPEHFTTDGKSTTPELTNQIKAIDPGYQVGYEEPVFVEAATRKELKISEYGTGRIDLQAMMNNINKPKDVTFYSVMNTVFGKR